MGAPRAAAPAGRTGVQPMGHRQTLEALSGLFLVLFVSMLSSTVVSTALPKILGDLNGTQTQYTWVVTATLLTSTASTPIWGKLADLFNKKLLVQLAIVVFVLGSIVCGFSNSAGQLIAARAFQGIGVGGLQALSQVVIGAMIPPRERGRYNGYLGAVMAVATVSGPLLGGFIVDSDWLGWRWCFFVGVPVAAIALVVLQMTLTLPTIRREDVKIDYLGATTITSAVSVLLIWVSFVDDSFAWVSWQTFVMVGVSLLLFALAVFVESRAAEPVVPLPIVRQRTTALSIIASFAVGTAMFGATVFLSQYFQTCRGYSPTKAGLLIFPLMIGVLVASVVGGQLVSRTGRIKPFVVTGVCTMIVAFGALGVIDHQTSLVYIGIGMAVAGLGVGMTMQNLVLAVQNSVALKDIGAGSSTIAFFRSLGGAIGVSVLGSILARNVKHNVMNDLAAAGIHVDNASGSSSSLNLKSLPPMIQHIMRVELGDAIGEIFLIAAGIAVVGLIAVLFLKPVTLRSSLDLQTADSAEQGSAEQGSAEQPSADQGGVDQGGEPPTPELATAGRPSPRG